jgi:aspartyl-tRNA(Asn)/glutamyl-tRNA(Gln) amidotransferase subunit A
MSELQYLPAIELARLIRNGDVSAVEVMEDTLSRAEASQAGINAFITLAPQQALAAAQAVDTARAGGETLPPLAGIPFSAKDLINTAGIRTTFGSRLLEDNVPDSDSICVTRMKNAGAILFGKTTTPEFGHKPLTEAPLFGRTANPWDTSRTCGGSSGGAAAAAAAGLGPLAIGTDGGGSIRIPAACCGVVGMKPTLGRIPHDQSADAFASMVYFGPMTRTVGDAAAMVDAMSGPASCDPYATHESTQSYQAAAESARELDNLRIAWRPHLGNQAVDAQYLARCEEAVMTLGDFGAGIEEVDTAFENTEWLWLILTHSIWASRLQQQIAEDRQKMDPTLLAQTDLGGNYTAIQVQDALRARTTLFREVQGWFDIYDLVVMPTLTRTAVPIDQDALGDVVIEGVPAGSLRGSWYPYTHPFNLTGHPAITLPCGFHADGLPIGLQIVAPWLREDLLFRAAALFEKAMPWSDRRPVC